MFKYLGLTLHKSATLKLVTAAEVHLLLFTDAVDQKSLQRQQGALIFPQIKLKLLQEEETLAFAPQKPVDGNKMTKYLNKYI